MKKSVILFLVLDFFVLVNTNWAQYMPSYFIPQFSRPNDPVGTALGLTGSAYRTGAVSALSNPAGLAYLSEIELNVSHIPSHSIPFWSQEYVYNQEAFAIGVPISNLVVLGLHFFNLNYGEVTFVDITGSDVETGMAGIRQIGFSMAKNFQISASSNLSLGLNLKYLDSYIVSLNTTATLGDFGIRATTHFGPYWFSFGSAASNFGTKMKSEGLAVPIGTDLTEDVYQLLRAGIALGNSVTAENHSVRYMMTVEYQQNIKTKNYDDWKHIGGGTELTLFNHLYGRIGYNFDLKYKGDDKFQGLTYGFGFRTPEEINIIIPLTFEVSYGHGVRSGILDVNVISLSLLYNLNSDK